jgi:hypothetical protein
MSYIAQPGEKSTSSESALLTEINNLADSAYNQFLAKVGGVIVNKVMSASGTVVYNEIMTGNLNQNVFTSAHIPTTVIQIVSEGGQLLTLANGDYTVIGNSFTFTNLPTQYKPQITYIY